jgi:uncharacterized protein YbjT (DUF2867 family)
MILLTGGSGTLGKEIARQLTQGQRDFRCLVRKTSNLKDLEKMGAKLCFGDVTDPGSIKQAMKGVKAVLSTHSLGIQKKGITYWDVDYQGNLALIQSLLDNGGGKFVYISSLGASLGSSFQLYRVKQLIEDALKVSGLNYTVFKPSGFFSDFTMSANMVKKYHLYPSMGWGDHKIQGIDVGNLAFCVIDSITNDKANNCVFSIGGPEVLTFKSVAAIYSTLLRHNVRILPIPTGLQKTVGWIVDSLTCYRYEIQGFIDAFSHDSICDNGPLLNTFDIRLIRFEDYLADFLETPIPHKAGF